MRKGERQIDSTFTEGIRREEVHKRTFCLKFPVAVGLTVPLTDLVSGRRVGAKTNRCTKKLRRYYTPLVLYLKVTRLVDIQTQINNEVRLDGLVCPSFVQSEDWETSEMGVWWLGTGVQSSFPSLRFHRSRRLGLTLKGETRNLRGTTVPRR